MFGAVAFAESDKNIVYVAGENEFSFDRSGRNMDHTRAMGPPGNKARNPIDMVVSKTDPILYSLTIMVVVFLKPRWWKNLD